MASPINISFSAVELDLDAQDKFITSNGVELLHYRAVACPIGMVEVNDVRAPHHEHSECSNGYIYELAGTVLGMPSNNSAMTSLEDIGLLDGSIMNITFPRFYADKPDKRVYVQLYDRFYIKGCEVLAPNTQRVEAHITGIDKLTYRAQQVEDPITDANGRQYTSADYRIENGNLVWTSDNRPGFDATINKGTIYSVRYLYSPYFYVSRIMHEIRIAHRTDFVTGERKSLRAPYAALLSREYYLYKEQRNEGQSSEDTRRDMPAPRDAMFGPR